MLPSEPVRREILKIYYEVILSCSQDEVSQAIENMKEKDVIGNNTEFQKTD